MTLDQALDKLDGRDSRKLGNNTYLERIDADTVGIRLHRTYVVTLHDGRFSLDSGGWRTPTTKSRMNDYAPCRVVQERGEWWVCFNGERHRFTDGITFSTVDA